MKPVTDPNLLAQLEGGDSTAQLKPVTDPKILAQLEGQDAPTQKTAAQKFIESNPVTAGLAGLGGGLVKAATGVIQTGAQLAGADNIAASAGRVTQQANDNLKNLGTSGQIGGFVGEVAPFVALPANATTLAGRMALGAAGGAAQGALKAQETPSAGQRVVDAATGVAIGAVAPAALAGVGKAAAATRNAVGAIASDFAQGVAKPEAVKAAKEAVKAAAEAPRTSDAFKQLANVAYQKAADAGGVLKPETAQKFIDAAQAIAPSSAWGKAAAGESPATQMAQRLQSMQGKPMSLADAQELDSMLGELAFDNVRPSGQMTALGKKYFELQQSLRETISATSTADVIGGKQGFVAWKQGRDLWSKAMNLQDIERIATRAELSDKPYTALKSGLRTLASNPKRMKMLPPDVQDAVRQGAKDGVSVDALRVLSSRLLRIGGGTVGGVKGYVVGNLANLAADGALNSVVARRLDNIAGTIANGGKVSGPSLAQRAGATIGKATGVLGDQSGSIPSGPKALAGMATLAGGLGAANFGSSLATNTQYDPAQQTTEMRDRAQMQPDINAQATRLTAAENQDLPQSAATPPITQPATEPQPSMMQRMENGISDMFRRKVSQAESSGGKNLYAKTSNAVGEFQFVPKTWLSLVNKYKPEWAKGKTNAELLKLRLDPQISAQMFDTLTQENTKALQKSGIPVSDTEAYAAHVLGVGDAIKVLKANPKAPLSKFVSSDKISRNKSIMQGKTVGQFIDVIRRKMNG